MSIYEIPENRQKIDNLYVILSHDADGNEGIVSCEVFGKNFPMVGGYESVIEFFSGAAKQMAEHTGVKLILVKFSREEILREFTNAN